jgi:hypothetical protein
MKGLEEYNPSTASYSGAMRPQAQAFTLAWSVTVLALQC